MQVGVSAALDLLDVPLHLRFDVAAVDASHGQRFLIDDEVGRLAVDDGGQRQLGLPGRADLAHQQQIQRRIQRAGHDGADGYPAAGQRQHDQPAGQRHLQQALRQRAAGFAAIGQGRLHRPAFSADLAA